MLRTSILTMFLVVFVFSSAFSMERQAIEEETEAFLKMKYPSPVALEQEEETEKILSQGDSEQVDQEWLEKRAREIAIQDASQEKEARLRGLEEKLESQLDALEKKIRQNWKQSPEYKALDGERDILSEKILQQKPILEDIQKRKDLLAQKRAQKLGELGAKRNQLIDDTWQSYTKQTTQLYQETQEKIHALKAQQAHQKQTLLQDYEDQKKN